MPNRFVRFWQGVGGFIAKAFRAAQERGLTDEIIELALRYVVANTPTGVITDADKAALREQAVTWIVSATGVSESIARLALEAAYQLYRRREEQR